MNPSAAFAELVLEGLGEPVIVIGPDHRVVMMNRAARNYHLGTEYGGNRSCFQVLHGKETPCFPKEAICALRVTRETGEPVTLEHWHRSADGRERLIEFVATPMFDSEGGFAGIIESAHDITDRRKQEELIARGKAEWEATVDAVADLVFLTDREGQILRCNRSVVRLFRKDFPDLLGRDIRELFRGETAQPQSFFDANGGELEIAVPRRRFEFTRFPVFMKENHFGFVFVLHDITELKRLESIAASVDMMNNLGQVLSVVRHEIGNSLNAIKTALTVLQEGFDSWSEEKKRDYVARCLDDTRRMEDLLEQLRTFNLFGQVVSARLDIVPSLEQIATRIRDRLRDEGIAFECALPDPGPVEILGDRRALQQALLSLVSNAIDAVCGRVEPWIKLELGVDETEVRLCLEDNGSGIDPEDLDKVILPLYTTKPDGTGLGLAIAHTVVTKMNGTLRIHTVLGEGTRMEITLPRIPKEDLRDS